MQIDFTELIIAILGIIFSLISAAVAKYVIPWLRERGLDSFSAKLVPLAWSLFEDGQGKEKFDYVYSKLKSKYGKWFDVDEIRAAIQEAYINFCATRGVEPSRGSSDDSGEDVMQTDNASSASSDTSEINAGEVN